MPKLSKFKELTSYDPTSDLSTVIKDLKLLNLSVGGNAEVDKNGWKVTLGIKPFSHGEYTHNNIQQFEDKHHNTNYTTLLKLPNGSPYLKVMFRKQFDYEKVKKYLDKYYAKDKILEKASKEEKYHDENDIANKLTILMKSSSTFSKSKLVHKSNDAYLLITFQVKVDAIDAHDIEFINKTLKHLPAMYYQIVSIAKGVFQINFVGYP